MNGILWMLCGIVANMVIGAGVWAAIDTEDKRLLRWYTECPPQVAWLAQPLVLMAWPIFLWLWWKETRDEFKVK